MKKIVLAGMAILLVGCAGLPNINLPFLQASTPQPAVVNSPAPTVTLVSDSWTNTPDLFATNTPGPTETPESGTPHATSTKTPFPTIPPTARSTITLEPVDITLFTPGPNPFSLLSKSTTQLVWGYTCDGARSIKFVVQVVAPLKRLKYVTLWYRLQDKYSARQTPWGGGAIMADNDRGTYFYTLELSQIDDYKQYYDAWLQFQFVASNIFLHRLGASTVDRTSVSLTHCSILNP